MSPLPYCVALTGGIASGKSVVADGFAALGADVLDADIVSRELVEPGRPALAEILIAFGPEALASDGTLDRRAMRRRIFADTTARYKLEAILHPRVRATLRERAIASKGPYVILVIPLLVESGRYDWVDRVLVVDVARETQRDRLLIRDGVTAELADAMLDAQASRERRLALADDVIDNHGTLAELAVGMEALHQRYVALAQAKRRV